MDTDDLNRLIRSLNSTVPDRGDSNPLVELVRGEETPAAVSTAPATLSLEAGVPPRLSALLSETVRRGGTDLLLVPGSVPILRLHGRLEPIGSTESLTGSEAHDLLSGCLSGDRRKRYLETGACDLSLHIAHLGRFRVNLHRTRRGSAAAIRVLPKRIPTLTELGLPESLYEIVRANRGLVLVTGATGSGKTTTLAALIDRINRAEKRHVVTIEDPVEYEHAHARSVVEQIEVGVDAASFSSALTAALRQDPDVILVGEMRDLETARTTLTAAETGHMVLTTLHTNDVPQTVNRILDMFPAEQQGQVRQQLSLALLAIVSQQLIPTRDGTSRAAAVEILLANDSIRAHIRRGSFHQLHSELTLGRRFGMVTMEESLATLVKAGTVAESEARLRASHPEDLTAYLK